MGEFFSRHQTTLPTVPAPVLDCLQTIFEAGMLGFFNPLTHFGERDACTARVQAMRGIDWVDYAKKPFGGPVLAYLGRYTRRVAIANTRIEALDDDQFVFTWKDYRQNGAEKIVRLKPDEFIRRFFLHTLPDGFHRIRYFGFVANGHRAAKIASCRVLLVDPGLKAENTPSSPDSSDKDAIDASDASVPIAAKPCGSSRAFFPLLGAATLPRRHFAATRHETGFGHAKRQHRPTRKNTIPITLPRESRRGFVQSGFHEVPGNTSNARLKDLTEAPKFRCARTVRP